MNHSTAGKVKKTILDARPAVERSTALLPLTFIGNTKAVPNIDVDRTFFNAVGIAMLVATLVTGSITVVLATHANDVVVQEVPVSGIEIGVLHCISC